MNQISPLATGGAVAVATQITPLISWALTGFKGPMPSEVPGIIAALAVAGVHYVGNVVASRTAKPTS